MGENKTINFENQVEILKTGAGMKVLGFWLNVHQNIVNLGCYPTIIWYDSFDIFFIEKEADMVK